ncbi:MAG: glycoside hydrolase family 3 C-terminal domain-containing protein, partial [Oscillospiraceae bacterium]|nr:glycoside hydrolase family 3 C-terminal domain-containing protein [Oscillospiraceae bacterium]
PSIFMADGPYGVRKITGSETAPAVCFPTPSLAACSWDRALLGRMGSALGDAARSLGVNVLLGPGLNIKRSPLCGRNFEYFSEDPYLSGALGAAVINGVQGRGVGVAVKHFAVNNQETRRMAVDAVADERALREIYLPAFEMSVKQAKPWMVMASYNKFEGVYVSENSRLQNDILRGEWGFNGAIVSDWGGVRDRAAAVGGGLDLEMPYSFGRGEESIIDAVNAGTLSRAALDRSVDRMLTLIDRAQKGNSSPIMSKEEQHALAREIAAQSMVLLKNEGHVLPLDKSKSIAVIGEFAESPRFQGAGSSNINATNVESALRALKDAGARVKFARGFRSGDETGDPILQAQAVNLAKKSDAAVIFAGLPAFADGEGMDRAHLDLPGNQNRLIEAVAGANPNTVVVYCGGSAVLLPWLERVKGFLCTYLPGEAGGGAVADILLGKANPSGKLCETWPLAAGDVPCAAYFPGNPKSAEYRESIFVGYRYYDTFGKPVRFPFGFGLSYTEFAYSGLKINGNTVTCTIKNTGNVAGAEIAQLYVRDVKSTAFRPEKELKGFEKVFLKPGESKQITFKLDERSFAFYNTETKGWCVEAGAFELLVGASCGDIRLKGTVTKEGAAAGTIPDLRTKAPAYYGLGGNTPADVPAAQFTAVLGRPLPPRDLPKGAEITINDSLEDALRLHPAEQRIWDFAVDPVMQLIMKTMTNGAYVSNAMQAPMFSYCSMTSGVLDSRTVEGIRKLCNDDWSGLLDLAASVPGIIGNLPKLMENA